MSAFASRSFRLFWLGEAVSVTGSAAASVLLPLLAVHEFGAGPFWMGAIAAATWLPWLVIGLPMGAWVDARDPRRTMMNANVVAAAASASLPLATLAGVGSLAQVVVVAFVVGSCSVAFRSAYAKLIVRLVPQEQRPSANSILFGTENAGHTIGPGVGGALGQAVGATIGVLTQAFGLVISAVCLFFVRLRPAAGPAPEREPLRRSIAAGLRLVFGDRYLRFFALQGAAANFGLTGQTALLVLWLTRDLALEPAIIGAAFAVSSVGGILGALAAPRVGSLLGTARGATWALTIGGFAVTCIALAQPGPVLWLVVVVNGLGAAGITIANVLRRTWVQDYVPEAMLARQSTSTQLVNFGTMPLAGLVAGALGEVLDLRLVIALMGAIVALANLACWSQAWLRSRDLPEAAPSLRA